ncbi:MAG TPA: glutamate-1-semialdehyde 2,1-aminomutase [Acidimicrobiales bacterium]|nr:glutamate-1-semialdehyde 2,1-aminomutase [Acidimicrobiales bacterium]
MAEARASNAAWFERARRVIPGGVDSPVRSFSSVGGTPYTVVAGEGAFVVDAEGTRYVDLVQSYGAVLLGHAHPAVTKAIGETAVHGTTFGAPTPGEVLLAEAICERVPGCEQVRLVSSGTEAAMSAVRLARGATGRDGIVKFDGCYHGHSDGLLAGGGSGVATLGLPGSAGVSAGAVADTRVVPYNVLPELDARMACVIVEPVAANMNLVAPAPGFLEALRAACDAAGALLIFDEVISGFRLGPGGATAWSGVTPDLWCFGKVIGGGLPVGAFGGRRDLMAELAPAGPVYQAGTLSGNPLATAAGLAVLGQVGPADYEALAVRAAALARDLQGAVAAGGLSVVAPVVGPLVGLFLAPAAVGATGSTLPAPRDYVEARALAAGETYGRFFHAMLRRGVALAPGPYEVMFPGMAHDEAVLARVVEAAGEAAAEVAAGSAATEPGSSAPGD